jgi:hypothetical protein
MRSKLGAIYLGVATWAFLVLPTCPCQLLIMFGIDVHGVRSGPQEVEVSSKPTGYPIGHCRCESEILKTAEVVDPCVDGEAAWVDGGSIESHDGFIDVRSPLVTLIEASEHPPPDVGPGASVPEFFCVYRL